MVDKSISMNVNDTLELDYLVEEVSDSVVSFNKNPNGKSDTYVSRNSYIFDPNGTGTYEFDIKGQTIEVEVTDIPDSVVHLGGYDGGSHVNTIYEYDPSTDSIATMSATLPTALRGATGGVIDGKFYHLGGYDGGSVVNTIYEYDPSTDSIATMSATLPTALHSATGGVIDGKFYHLGGYDGGSNVNTIYEYDPSSDSIATMSATLPTALRLATGGAV